MEAKDKFKVDAIDEVKNHVSYTVSFKDGSTHQEKRGDLPSHEKEELLSSLREDAGKHVQAHERALEMQEARKQVATEVVGQEFDVDEPEHSDVEQE